MRKRLTIILIFFSLKIQAQEPFIPETFIGIKQGINGSRVNFKPTIDQNITFGYLGGLIFKHISEKNAGIQIELNYSQQGWTEKLDSTNSYFKQLNNINLPFMSHFEIGKGKTKILINFGPTLSYLLSEKENIKIDSVQDERIYYGKLVDNRFEYGLSFGIGIVKNTKIGSFQIEGRFNQSLVDIFKQTTEPSISSSKIQTVELSISYLIDFKKPTKLTDKRTTPVQK